MANDDPPSLSGGALRRGSSTVLIDHSAAGASVPLVPGAVPLQPIEVRIECGATADSEEQQWSSGESR